MYKISFDEDLNFYGFFNTKINSGIPLNSIAIDKDLYEYLKKIGSFKLTKRPTKEVLTLQDAVLFKKTASKYIVQDKTDVELLEEQAAFLIKESLEKDIQIKELNMNLAQTTLKSVNKDIEINNLNTNMAKTTLNLINKDIKIKDIEKDVANLILKSLTLGGN